MKSVSKILKALFEASVLAVIVISLPMFKQSAYAAEALPTNLEILKYDTDGSLISAIVGTDYQIVESLIHLEVDNLVITSNGNLVSDFDLVFDDFATIGARAHTFTLKDLKISTTRYTLLRCEFETTIIIDGNCSIESKHTGSETGVFYSNYPLQIVPASSNASLYINANNSTNGIGIKMMDTGNLTLGDDTNKKFNITIESAHACLYGHSTVDLIVKQNVNLTCKSLNSGEGNGAIESFDAYKFYGNADILCEGGSALRLSSNTTEVYTGPYANVTLRTNSSEDNIAAIENYSNVVLDTQGDQPNMFGSSVVGTTNPDDVNEHVVVNRGSVSDRKIAILSGQPDRAAKTIVFKGLSPNPVIEGSFGQESTYYLDKLVNRLENAALSDKPQTVYWDEGVALPFDIMKFLQDHPNVTLIFTYTYENKEYIIKLDGKNVKADPKILWYGPLYLSKYYQNLK